MGTSLLSPQEFAGKIRAKYPGAYDAVPDDELTQRVVRKYPQYAGQVQLATTGATRPQVNMQQAPMSRTESVLAGLTAGPTGETGNVRNPKLEVALKGEDPTGKTGAMIGAAALGGVAGPALPYVRPAAQKAGQWVAQNPIKSMLAIEALKQTPLEPYVKHVPSWLPFLASEGVGMSGIARRKLGLPETEVATAEAGASEAMSRPRGEIRPPSTDQLPGRPYMPNPRYSPAPAPQPIPSRPGLMLEGEVAAGAAPVTRAELEAKLSEALGGKPLERGVSLRNQLARAPASTPTATNLPAGFTPTESSVLKGYRYDAGTRELESITRDNAHYIHGDISPQDIAAFESSVSKGAAWGKLKSSGVLVGKVINGRGIAVRPSSGTNTEALRNALTRKKQ